MKNKMIRPRESKINGKILIYLANQNESIRSELWNYKKPDHVTVGSFFQTFLRNSQASNATDD